MTPIVIVLIAGALAHGAVSYLTRTPEEDRTPHRWKLWHTAVAGFVSGILIVTVAALLGVKTSIEALRTRITLDSRDWTHDKVDAWLWALLVGFNCENTDEGHVHNDIDCSGDQALWNIGRKHDIPMAQTIQAGQLSWWIANAITVAKQIEEQPS